MNQGDLALMLTVLDKEAYNASYFDSARTDDDRYVESLEAIIRLHCRIMEQNFPDDVEFFLERNPHLVHCFEAARKEMKMSDSEVEVQY
jgi:hypothetical protein